MPEFDVFAAHCPARLVLARLADKWGILVLLRLGQGDVRFNQLRREVPGLSQKVLSATLKSLARDGLASRRAYPTVPVTVEYAITPLGRTLAGTVDALARWAEANAGAVLDARAAYDAGLGADAGGAAPQASRATT